jgi:hypothetical protein
VVGTETDRGLFIGALVAAGYQVYAVNPLAGSRYRDRSLGTHQAPVESEGVFLGFTSFGMGD